MSYHEFVAQKLAIKREVVGIRGVTLGDKGFIWQQYLVRWALEVGKAALFCECGLGKTWMQLEWARQVAAVTGGRVLILAPLAVAQQTVREGKKFGIPVAYARDQSEVRGAITITNYERLDKFDASAFVGVVLDESSIIKSFMGAVKRQIFIAFKQTPYKLACTATPSPNDHMELGQHAEFLDVLTSHEMLARWFINDTQSFGTYRLKGHAAADFWAWVSSWARCVGRPSDLGPEYSDEGYVLPALEVHKHVLDVDIIEDRGGELFRTPRLSATEVHKEKRRSIEQRAADVARTVYADQDEPWIIWCETDYEEEALTSVIPDAVAVNGSDSLEEKEAAALWFLGEAEHPKERRKCGNRNIPRGDANVTPPIPNTGSGGWSNPSPTRTDDASTCAITASTTPHASLSSDAQTPTSETESGEPAIDETKSNDKKPAQARGRGKRKIRGSALLSASAPTISPSKNTTLSSSGSEGSAPSARALAALTAASAPRAAAAVSTSTTATKQSASAGSSARPVILASASSPTTPSASSTRRVTSARILISKPRIFGFGLNFQHCARVAFVGPTFSFEQYYQAIRRSWRFGQKRPVECHVTMGSTEIGVWEILQRKAADHQRMQAEMFAAARRAVSASDTGARAYEPRNHYPLVPWVKEQA